MKAAARTYFYMNEAQCERNMEIFLQSIEAVSGNYTIFNVHMLCNYK